MGSLKLYVSIACFCFLLYFTEVARGQKLEVGNTLARISKSDKYIHNYLSILPGSLTLSNLPNITNVDISAECANDTTVILEAILSGQNWGLQVLDSIGKPPSGLLKGRLLWLGNYDECLSVTPNVTDVTDEPFSMQYCRAYFGNAPQPSMLGMSPTVSLTVGLCASSRCHATEVKALANAGLHMIMKTENVSMVICQPKFAKVTSGAITMTTLLSLLILIVIFATWLELHHGNRLRSDVVVVNEDIIDAPDEQTPMLPKTTKLEITENPADFIEYTKKFTFQAIFYATVSVDSFFLLSGLLMCYLYFNNVEKDEQVSWWKFYFHRFWRLTPVYMLVLGSHTTLTQYFGDGPLWSYTGFDAYCSTNWWTNLLYINNLVHPNQQCMGWAWYLANDMQFFVISPLFLLLLHRNWKLGIVVMTVVLVGSLTAAGIISTSFGFSANYLQLAFSGNFPKMFQYLYVPPYSRIGPYLVGIVVGYGIHRTKQRARLPRLLASFLWCCAIAINMSVLYGLYGVMQGDPISQSASSFYLSCSRTGWALGLGWLIFACINGYGGFVNTLLSWKAFVPLSRLTYCAYLVHPVVIIAFTYARRNLLYFNVSTLIYQYLSGLTLSYGLAFVVSATMEAPLIALEKVFL